MVRGMSSKLVCIDVGNTSATYGVYGKRGFDLTGYSSSDRSPSIIYKLLNKVSNIPSIDVLLSSVVPKITSKLLKSLSHRKGVRVWVVGANLKVPIKHKYKHINRLGADRLVTAYGAMKIYGAPILILDFGTALTCDYVSSRGVFEGGLIIPGPQISLKALYEKTALLPSISFPHSSPSLIGRDTKTCMKSGILHGYGALVDGLVERFYKRYGKRLRVVATGGLARNLSPYMSRVDIVDPLLTLKSLERLFKAQVKSSS